MENKPIKIVDDSYCTICNEPAVYEIKFFNLLSEKHLVFTPAVCRECFTSVKNVLLKKEDKFTVTSQPEEVGKKPKKGKKKTVDQIFQDFARDDKFDINDFKQDQKKIIQKMEKAARTSRKTKDINEAILKRAQGGTESDCKHKEKIITDRDKGYEACADCGVNLINGKQVG